MRLLNRTRVWLVVAPSVLAAGSLAGCSASDDGNVDAVAHESSSQSVQKGTDGHGSASSDETDTTGGAARIAIGEETDVFLFVSNQSFYHEQVPIEVSIDGVTVVDQQFDVEGQHTWIQFPIALDTETVAVTATVPSDPTTDRETEVSETFSLTVPQGEQRWMSIGYSASGPASSTKPASGPRIDADIADQNPGFD